MAEMATGALIGWRRGQSPDGAFIRLQLAASPEALEARDFTIVTMSLNDIRLQSFARDLQRAMHDRGFGIWPRIRWWLPRLESVLAIANALLGLIIDAAAEILSLLLRGCRRLVLWRTWIEGEMHKHAVRPPSQPLPTKRRRRRRRSSAVLVTEVLGDGESGLAPSS